MNEVREEYYIVKMTDGKFLVIIEPNPDDPFLTTTEDFHLATRYEERKYGLEAAKVFENKESDDFKALCDKDAKFEKFMKIKITAALEEDE